MREFQDRDGRTWRIDLTIGDVFRVKAASDGVFDLTDPVGLVGGEMRQIVLATDPLRFWELLQLLVDPQAEQAGITAEQFGRSMSGDCLLVAQAKFFDEWRDFFRSLRRPDAALAVESQMKTMTTAMRMVAEKVALLDTPDLEKRIEAKVAAAVNTTFGAARESLDATLGPTPGGSLP